MGPFLFAAGWYMGPTGRGVDRLSASPRASLRRVRGSAHPAGIRRRRGFHGPTFYQIRRPARGRRPERGSGGFQSPVRWNDRAEGVPSQSGRMRYRRDENGGTDTARKVISRMPSPSTRGLHDRAGRPLASSSAAFPDTPGITALHNPVMGWPAVLITDRQPVSF